MITVAADCPQRSRKADQMTAPVAAAMRREFGTGSLEFGTISVMRAAQSPNSKFYNRSRGTRALGRHCHEWAVAGFHRGGPQSQEAPLCLGLQPAHRRVVGGHRSAQERR